MSQGVKSFVLLSMIFLHILDDFTLQGILANMKQKKWWKDHTSNEMYENDWTIALLLHAFSWTFSIMLPIAVVYSFDLDIMFMLCFVANFIVHSAVDNLKANKLKINLIQDQFMHLFQIVLTSIILLRGV